MVCTPDTGSSKDKESIQDVYLEYRPYDPDYDFEIVESWWDNQSVSVPDGYSFGSSCGLVVELNDDPAGAGFLYPIPGTQTATMGWISFNPEYDQEERKHILLVLTKYAKVVALNAGYKNLFVATDSPEIKETLKESGFQEAARGISYLYYEPCGRA